QPEGKHVFGTVKVGERGQIVIPKKAREIFNICPQDSLLVLGDQTTPNMIQRISGIFERKPLISKEI
ncbi:MAG: AbrB/MazE/SpoVT family DNA-binding domain-containing protein, partial [Candidatus Absconditabacteria bacterium]|nr:AbrB/MazE/SpoVT family DNA-binding domain-containing protein [Candidatus Absconditabacteria bacterium]